MKILIALVDPSDSERMVQFVTCMRWPAGSRVIVAAVKKPGPTGLPPRDDGAGADAPSDPGRNHAAIVTRVRDRLRAGGLSTETRIVEGEPRERLLALIEAERADLAVVGSYAPFGAAKSSMGAVASHVLNHAPCSVLVVKLRSDRLASAER